MTNKLETVLAKIRETFPKELIITHWSDGGKTADVEYPPIKLEHLLIFINKHDTKTSTKAIEETIIRFTIEAIIGQDVVCLFTNYDLAKSVERNLKDNPELLDFVFSLFNQEDL